MAQIDWDSIINGQSRPKRRYAGANVKFFFAYNENKEKSLKEGRPIFDEIPSISIQWPGGDETVRRIEPQDIQEYPEKYAQFKAGSEPVTDGTPLSEWPMINGSAIREFNYLGFKTVEQVAAANDDVKRRVGPLGRFIKLAKEWLDAANSTQTDVTKLKVQLEKAEARAAALEHKLELFMQRVEANEGTDLRGERRKIAVETQVEESLDDEDMVADSFENYVVETLQTTPKRRGRPKRA